LSTVRTAASSSATRILPDGIVHSFSGSPAPPLERAEEPFRLKSLPDPA
jgi:hypothetical protein